jgi:hypothetical protein
MPKLHDIQRVAFDGPIMVLEVDGHSYRLALSAVSPRLAAASEPQRNFFRVSASGYGIHWPEIDEDLSVDGLIRAAAGTNPATIYPTKASASVLNDKPKS